MHKIKKTIDNRQGFIQLETVDNGQLRYLIKADNYESRPGN